MTKKMEMDVLFDEYKIILLKKNQSSCIDSRIEKNIDAAAYENKFTTRNKATIKEEIN